MSEFFGEEEHNFVRIKARTLGGAIFNMAVPYAFLDLTVGGFKFRIKREHVDRCDAMFRKMGVDMDFLQSTAGFSIQLEPTGDGVILFDEQPAEARGLSR